MLRAYKKKKREIAKLKETIFKLETEFLTMKQNQTLVEEELTSTKKKLSKSEKNLKLVQMREQKNDSSLIEKQLMLKAKEVEVFQ